MFSGLSLFAPIFRTNKGKYDFCNDKYMPFSMANGGSFLYFSLSYIVVSFDWYTLFNDFRFCMKHLACCFPCQAYFLRKNLKIKEFELKCPKQEDAVQ